VKQQGKERTEIAYGITTIPKEKADTERLLELNRNHWSIDNSLYYRRDITMGEDNSQIRIKGYSEVVAVVNGGYWHVWIIWV
jgi:predicted transposase YbfD/YdcC